MKTFLTNLALLLARATLGLIFVFAGLAQVRHGASNRFMLGFRPEWLAQNVFDAYGKTLPWLEIGVGALLALGLFTRVAGILLFLLAAFCCATIFQATTASDNPFLLTLAFASFGLVLSMTGGGAWALEERMGGGKSGGGDKPAKPKKE